MRHGIRIIVAGIAIGSVGLLVMSPPQRADDAPAPFMASIAQAGTAREAMAAKLREQHVGIEYFVSNQGKDSNPGTAAAPFATLQHAANHLLPGDTVRVRPGNYIGINLDSAGGTPGHPITFVAEQGATIISSAKVGPNPDSGFNVEHAGGTNWLVIGGFRIRGADGTMARAGVRLTGCTHTQVLDCDIENAGGNWGIFVSRGSDLLIQGNTCRNSGGQHGIYVSSGSRQVTIRRNHLAGNHWDGLHLNGGDDGPIDNCVIEENIIHNNQLSGMDCDGVQNSVFRNNLVYANQKHAITLYNRDTATGCLHNLLIHNTLISISQFAVQMQRGSTANTLYNNILFQSGRPSYGSIGVRGTPTGLISDYNVVVDRFSSNLGETRMGLEEWRSRTGQDAHSISVTYIDTLFAAPATEDYHLKAHSPAIGPGMIVHPSVERDMDGKPRPAQGRCDIGAYSFAKAKPLK